MTDLKDKFRGALLGLAACDALGTTLEFKPPGTFQPISDIVGGGPFDLEAGQWTDDTSMAMCLAESLIEQKGFDPKDQMFKYIRWYRDGYWSSIGRCFDIGNTTRSALYDFQQDSSEPYARTTSPRSAGNGSIMRLVPVVLFFSQDKGKAIKMAGESSRTTHGAIECIDACRLMAAIIVKALQGKTKEEILETESIYFAPKVQEINLGSYKEKNPPEINGTGYVVQSLEAALWAFHNSESFEEGALKAVNLGDDADTTGAVYGQIAGAFYGESAIPVSWREKLTRGEEIGNLADRLLELS